MIPLPVSGYVLAGGKSSRMGRDKALLELGGRPLIAHAVTKLRGLCSDVFILSSRPELAEFAPLVVDLHPECGPLGGMEAALLHATCAWSMLLPVDMPFLPQALLQSWMQQVLAQPNARIGVFLVEDRPQPALCLLHREMIPFVQRALQRGEFKLFSALEGAAKEIGEERGLPWEEVLFRQRVEDGSFFANLNTPEEFAVAERRWNAMGSEAVSEADAS